MHEKIVKQEVMDPSDKQATYDAFMTLTKWSGGAVVVILILMAFFLL